MMRKNLIYLAFALLSLPLVLATSNSIQRLLTRAAPQTAHIAIDTLSPSGVIPDSFVSFAQGGEEPPPMLHTVFPKVKEVSPRYIRLDHIYDSYGIVKREDKGFTYDFSQLDQTIDDILAMGALPFLSLSYMPPSFTQSGSVIDTPSDWNNWKDLVQKTVEHYSGKQGKNLTNVYYEVWNEPELPQFGSWKLSSEKDYRLLYYYAEKGAHAALNVNQFFLGGPAVGSYYSSWVRDFLSYVKQNKLRLDFYSWHRYHKRPDRFTSDAINIRKDLSLFPEYATLPLILSEWGIESENTSLNNTDAAAAFAVSAISKFQNSINLAFSFEIKDGPPPAGGKWGLFTHEKDTPSLSPKPRFKAFSALSKMKGNRLNFSGSGTFVDGFAAKEGQTTRVILSNYDLASKNTENVPVTFTGLSPASYLLTYTYPLDGASATEEIISTNGTLSKSFILSPNAIILLELIQAAPIATFISGTTGQTEDQALALSSATPLTFVSPEFRLRARGTISFDLKPFWESNDQTSFLIFDAPYSTASGIINRLFLARQKKPEGQVLTFGIAGNKEDVVVTMPISDWQRDTWRSVRVSWNYTGISIAQDTELPLKNETPVDIRNGELFTFYPINAALDNLDITLGEDQKIMRSFDGRVDK